MTNSDLQPNDFRQPDLHKANVGGSYIVVPQHKEFKFKKACPYCGGDITAQADSWEQQDDGSWMADHFAFRQKVKKTDRLCLLLR